MALTIPDTISSGSRGEKRLFKVLRDELPDDFFIYYEPNIKGSYPDFIILSPELGLLILEVISCPVASFVYNRRGEK